MLAAGAGIDNGEAVYVSSRPAYMLAPYHADDGNCEVEYTCVDSGREAAQEYVDSGDWGDSNGSTTYIDVSVWRNAFVLDVLSDAQLERINEESHTIAIEPEEPACIADDHDWQSPYEVLGGLEENPGVHGHGGGVIIREVCANCGRYRITDTWAQRRDTGEQGLRSVSYEDADEASSEWVESLAEAE
jgi:hypothetical protein